MASEVTDLPDPDSPRCEDLPRLEREGHNPARASDETVVGGELDGEVVDLEEGVARH